jgi:NADPH:quinone reductase-like Zn-dependent oxidoreductase
LPAILGRDASGEVVEVGPGVTRFKVGAKVLGLVMGAYAEFVIAPIDAWAEVPLKLDLADAAALPLVLLTGAQLIEEWVQPHTGDLVLVTGAVGSVGRVAVYVAKAHGARVLAGVRTSQKAAAALLGASSVVALDDDLELAGLPRLDAIADTVGGPTILKLFDHLKAGGTIGSVVGAPDGAVARGFIVRGGMAHVDPARLAALAGAVAEGKLLVPIAKRFPLAQAKEAQTLAEHHAGGKVLLIGTVQLKDPARPKDPAAKVRPGQHA